MVAAGKALKVASVVVIGAALAPALVVQGVIALRTNYRTNCAADAWMSKDFRLWADELRAMK